MNFMKIRDILLGISLRLNSSAMCYVTETILITRNLKRTKILIYKSNFKNHHFFKKRDVDLPNYFSSNACLSYHHQGKMKIISVSEAKW